MTPTPNNEALAAEIKSLADEYAEASAADARHYAPGRKAAARVNLYVEIDRLASSGQAASAVPEGMRLVPVALLEDAIASIDDYRASVEFGASDRKLLGRLKAALASPTQPASAPAREGVVFQGEQITLDALEQSLRERLRLADTLERLTLWARTQVGRCECTGDHPIADAERALGWRKA